MKVLWFGSPESYRAQAADCAASDRWDVLRVEAPKEALARIRAGEADAIVVAGGAGSPAAVSTLLASVDATRVATLVVGGEDVSIPEGHGPLIDLAGADVSAAEITRRLVTLDRMRAYLLRLESEIETMHRLSQRLDRHFQEIDDEMRLASRLQQDFLPRQVDRIGPLEFALLYRPASWVSGDMCDICRIDERHVGFYVVDAVGHGVAAGLLTMFVKRAITMKRMDGSDYDVLDPAESLTLLNESLVQHALPNCQFVTALYCVVNLETLEMRYARGGHPYPLLLSADGGSLDLKSPGGLLGLFDEFEIQSDAVQLSPGDRVVLFTDGVEVALESDGGQGRSMDRHREVLREIGTGSNGQGGAPARAYVAELAARLDGQRGSLVPDDDVTVLVVGVSDDTAAT